MGFDLFVPRHSVDRLRRGALRQELRPVFGGYMFISATSDDAAWHKVQNAPGVSRLIGFGNDGPAIVPSEIVSGLMARCDDDGLLKPFDEQFAPGDQIKIVKGSFTDFIATIEHIGPDQRLYILLDFLGRPTKAHIDPTRVVRPA